MGQIRKPLPVKLIMSIFTQKDVLFNTAEKTLVKKLGAIDFRSQILDFNQTQYYKNEFGDNLKREIISFRKLIPPDSLWKIKIITNAIEDKLLKDKKRQINIDPGYITQANLILATTKDYSHRIYARRGIFEEVTLIFKNKTFTALPWTYPDYQSKELIDIFIQIRNILILQLKK
ncbi:MAG: DUF4416 family protein [Candidatus Omnitrophica bacterium]|nr:DUF4416 family protein [Candidatus Omnitrophota bacterium]